MKYCIVKKRPTLKMTPEELDAVLAPFVEEDEELTSPRIDLTEFWAAHMNDYPERIG